MLIIYNGLINIFYPFIVAIIFLRVLFKKEDKKRFKEKIFLSSLNFKKDKNKKLIWFHVASLGELKSIIPLIKILNEKKIFQFLITTVTLSSSQLYIKELSKEKNIIHKFFPIDKFGLVKKFLDNTSPDLTVFVDSEIWPNFILEIKKRNIPLALINARITKKTYLRWKLINKFAEKIFQSFDLCLTSNSDTKKYLLSFKVKNVKSIGNLKLTFQGETSKIKDNNKELLNQKKFWCAVSTHEGEDVFCLNTHINIKKIHNDILTIIIPRHVDRANKIKLTCKKFGLKSQILSDNELIDSDKEIIIINSYGVTSNYLKICNSVFVGKSMIRKLKQEGGQNPIEAAKLGCKIYHGPFVYNFKEIYEFLNKKNMSELVFNAKELSKKIINDLNNSNTKLNKNIDIINDLGEKILTNTSKELNILINK